MARPLSEGAKSEHLAIEIQAEAHEIIFLCKQVNRRTRRIAELANLKADILRGGKGRVSDDCRRFLDDLVGVDG